MQTRILKKYINRWIKPNFLPWVFAALINGSKSSSTVLIFHCIFAFTVWLIFGPYEFRLSGGHESLLVVFRFVGRQLAYKVVEQNRENCCLCFTEDLVSSFAVASPSFECNFELTSFFFCRSFAYSNYQAFSVALTQQTFLCWTLCIQCTQWTTQDFALLFYRSYITLCDISFYWWNQRSVIRAPFCIDAQCLNDVITF